jgi:hypothetical protein
MALVDDLLAISARDQRVSARVLAAYSRPLDTAV